MDILLYGVVWLLVAITAIFTVLPLLDVHHGLIRGGDFPRQQFLIVAVALLPIVWWIGLPGAVWAAVILVIVAAAQVFQIGRYLPIWHVQSLRPGADEICQPAQKVTLMAANVKKSNRSYHLLVDLAREVQPDILMALEVDQQWIDALEPLSDIFPHRYAQPYDNGYGMIILSRLEMTNAEFRDRIVEQVPSFRADVAIETGDKFRIYVVHPEPPVPDHDTEGRDAELAQIAFEVSEDKMPVVVSGDLNDVAWSSATRKFQQISQLLDPRVGRGFYNTFSAQTILMRWPLDQLFHSPHFRYIDMQRLPKIGSDHFPMLFTLALMPDTDAGEMPDEASQSSKDDAKEMIADEKHRDREAIGSDWEDED